MKKSVRKQWNFYTIRNNFTKLNTTWMLVMLWFWSALSKKQWFLCVKLRINNTFISYWIFQLLLQKARITTYYISWSSTNKFNLKNLNLLGVYKWLSDPTHWTGFFGYKFLFLFGVSKVGIEVPLFCIKRQ